MLKFQIPQKRIEGCMMPKKTFDTISQAIAAAQFNTWAEELGAKVDEAMNKALNIDNRLSQKTRKKIFDNFIKTIKADEKFRGYV